MRKYHEVSNLFPLMEGAEYEELKADIVKNGLIESIWLHPNGEIVDGRNRYRACLEAGVEPRFRTWDGNGSLVGFVVSMNLHRRHLTSSQRAVVALEVLPMLEEEARQRQAAATEHATEVGKKLRELNQRADRGDEAADLEAYNLSKQYRNEQRRENSNVYFIQAKDQVKIGVSICPEERLEQIQKHQPEAILLGTIPGDYALEKYLHKRFASRRTSGEWFRLNDDIMDEINSVLVLCTVAQNDSAMRAAAEAGKIVGVGYRYVSDAKKLQQEAPDLLEQVKAGDITIPQAKRDLNKRQRQDAPPLPSNKYRIIYADPPWKYDDKGLDGYGHAERHYPTLSITELCALGDDIKGIVEDNAVMFFWVTSPMLEDSFKIINAWGFKYKTSFVWDKVKHNFGHYNSVRHEFLLICTRGSCTPDVQRLFDSVQSIERSDVHSEKPEEFREIIDTIYPHGRRIELFARNKAEGWEAWGNEPV